VILQFPVQDNARPERSERSLNESVARARREHEILKLELKNLFERARAIRGVSESRTFHRELGQLHDDMKNFLNDLKKHSAWEDAELYPFAVSRLGADPDLYELMVLEYEPAERRILSCLKLLESKDRPACREDAQALSASVIQACAVLNNRLLEEDELMAELEENGRQKST